MYRFVFHFFLTLLLTNWAYREILLVAPEFDQLASKVTTTFQIPTHEKWEEMAKSNFSNFNSEKLHASNHPKNDPSAHLAATPFPVAMNVGVRDGYIYSDFKQSRPEQHRVL